MISALLAEVYQSLAEVFDQTSVERAPQWILLPGVEWPLLSTVVDLAEQRPSLNLEEAIKAIISVGERSADEFHRQYQTLFIGSGNPPIWLYESYYLDGRIPGPSTFAVKKLYSDAGLETIGAELPDQASIEWAFLAHLAEMEGQDSENGEIWRSAQRLFIKNHLMRWYPTVVRGLIRSGYSVWIAIGRICEAVLELNSGKGIKTTPQLNPPSIQDEDECTLCGFCVQECPTQALQVHEDDQTTAIWLSPSLCNGCKQCVQVCPEFVLSLSGQFDGDEKILLRKSPRSICPGCGKPTISEAELAFVNARLENPKWVTFCLECR
jgi:TorA maturation chaperone TorD/Fe-S-cluster-containing hydrogenase component 2